MRLATCNSNSRPLCTDASAIDEFLTHEQPPLWRLRNNCAWRDEPFSSGVGTTLKFSLAQHFRQLLGGRAPVITTERIWLLLQLRGLMTTNASRPLIWRLARPLGQDTGVKTPGGVRGDPRLPTLRVLNTLPKELGVHHKASVTSIFHDRNNHIGQALGAQLIRRVARGSRLVFRCSATRRPKRPPRVKFRALTS